MIDVREIRRIREQCGISAFEISIMTRIQPSYISKIEGGMIENVGVKTLDRILSAMGYELAIVRKVGDRGEVVGG